MTPEEIHFTATDVIKIITYVGVLVGIYYRIHIKLQENKIMLHNLKATVREEINTQKQAIETVKKDHTKKEEEMNAYIQKLAENINGMKQDIGEIKGYIKALMDK